MEEEEVAREDEEDAEVMAVVAAEVCGTGGGGQFLQKVRQRARPLSSTRPTATGAGQRGGGEERRGG